jgi:hypothetical protein
LTPKIVRRLDPTVAHGHHLTDSEGPQSVEQILAGTGLNRNACEQAIFRAKKAEQIIWVAPGLQELPDAVLSAAV